LAERVVERSLRRPWRLALRLSAAEHPFQDLAERIVELDEVWLRRFRARCPLLRCGALLHHLLDDLLKRIALAAETGGLHLAGRLLEEASHDHARQRRQHLLEDVLADTGRLGGLCCHSPRQFLGAEEVAEDAVALFHALRREGFGRILEIFGVLAGRQRGEERAEVVGVRRVALEPLAECRQQRFHGLLRLLLGKAELPRHLVDGITVLGLGEHIEKRQHGGLLQYHVRPKAYLMGRDTQAPLYVRCCQALRWRWRKPSASIGVFEE